MNHFSILIAAAGSGSGKTVISCGLMEALQQKGLKVSACKCGPDYIDPMFHREVLGVDSENLDLFFCERQTLRFLYGRHCQKADITVVEGVMGYYDGMGLNTDKGSPYDVACTLDIPVILVVPCKGMALSVLALIQGMLQFRENNHIKGILLNRISPMLYPKMKQMIEEGLEKAGYVIPVIGYVPEHEVFALESRHLGLVTPAEIGEIKKRLIKAGQMLSDSVDLQQLLQIAAAPVSTETQQPKDGSIPKEQKQEKPQFSKETVRIGIARDEAFCFYYKDNLQFLEEEGCRLIPFSPLHDDRLPEGLHGLLIGGGYPELYGSALEKNETMRDSIREALQQGLPCLAECGGFMYLQQELEDDKGVSRSMVGVISGKGFRTKTLGRFGYITIQAEQDGLFLKKGEQIKGHEFHYWDSTESGCDCMAVKPDGVRSWACIHMQQAIFAGYPHIHFYSNLTFARRFVLVCRKERGTKHEETV